VKENFGDRFKVKPRDLFNKVWTFRNTGETVWPEDTLFMQTIGDDLGAQPFQLRGPVRPGQEAEISI
jgi:hypothetical protein